MKIKLSKVNFYSRKKLTPFTLRSFSFLCLICVFSLHTNVYAAEKPITKTVQQQISGTVTDSDGNLLPGVSVLEKGTTNGKQTDFDGNFSITVSKNATLVFSSLGFKSKEVIITNQSTLSITLEEDISQLDEIVVVGYGTQKKVNVTASVSQVGVEVFENRPVANAARALQGAVPGLQITNNSSGGRPGSEPNINIRGFITANTAAGGAGNFVNAGPLILVDGIEMGINDIDPEDIKTVSVLKDAAAATVYGSRGASGVILITTKSGKDLNGKVRVNYNNNISFAQATQWPESASAIDFAYTVNDARANVNAGPYWSDEELGFIIQNMENPGSAPTLVPNAAGTGWDQSNVGLGATAATDWADFFFKDWAERRKHNLSISGGDEKLNYYISGGIYEEEGLLSVGDENYERYNLDVKISAKPKDWLQIEFLTKFLKSEDDYPSDTGRGTIARNTGRIFDLLSKVKPTLPIVDPFGEPLIQAYYPRWENDRYTREFNQIVLIPKIIIEPIKDWKITGQFNYKRDNNKTVLSLLTTTFLLPDESVAFARTQEQTVYEPTLFTSEYFSPNITSDYKKSFGNHNFDVLLGYQSELFQSYNLGAATTYLITDNVVSLNATLDDDQIVNESIDHLAIQSGFGRLRYNFDEKYLFEFNYRFDGNSKYEPGERTIESVSFSTGYNIAKEKFWPIKEISMFKLRGTYGSLGNQNGGNFLYLPILNVNSPGTNYLFNGQQALFSTTPSLLSQNLTWERNETANLALDVAAFNNKLTATFEWYRSDINGMAAQGQQLPAVLGANPGLQNIGASRVQGWELELNWQQKLGDFSYNIRGVLGDFKRTIRSYPNENNLLSDFFKGQDIGEIRGLQWDGWFMTDDEAANYEIDQSFVRGGTWTAGDTKYKDINGDGVIDQGTNTLGDSGDFSVIGNSTPRYQYSFTIGMNWKNFDLNMFIQGIGKRDVLVSNQQGFRGPAQGPFHMLVFEEHLDYFRPEDTTNPLGPNTDAYFPKPYAANPGNNNRNYRFAVDRYLQNGAYMRLKNLQIGYTIPRDITSKYKINKFRIFFSGENLLTISDLLFYDPENVLGGFGSAQAYPLSKVISAGINISL